MSYENTQCPCGGKKPTDTMLCDECNTAFSNRSEMAMFRNAEHPMEWRRHAATILLALARRRRTS